MSVLHRVSKQLAVGLGVALLVLLGTEGLVRLLPLERWTGDQMSDSHPLFIPGTGEDAHFYLTSPHFKGAMAQQRFARVKPAGVKRIFVLGGSAALGWPGPPAAAFTGYMQRALETVAPGRFEVLNVCAMSYGSHRVRDLLADVVRMEPDVIVIWSGNNEYIERNALSPHASRGPVRTLQRWLGHSSLYRTVRLLLQSTVPALFVRPAGPDLTDPRAVPMVRRGMLERTAETDRQVLDNYRANLLAMTEMIRASGAAGYLTTVPVNLSAWVPINLPPIAGSVQSSNWEQTRQAAFVAWEQDRFAEAIDSLGQLIKLTPDYAFAHYLLGDSYRHQKRYSEALVSLLKARDLDVRPVRALSAFNQTVRELATSTGLGLIELEGAFLESSGDSLNGLDLFLDYVHPNEAGHKLAAASVLAQIAPALSLPVSPEALARSIAQDDWLQLSDYNRAEYDYALGMTLFNNGRLTEAEQAYLRVLEVRPEFPEAAANLAAIYERRGDITAAATYYRRAAEADPGGGYALTLAFLLYRQEQRGEAREIAERLIREGAVSVDLLVLLGDIALDEGRASQAQGYYQEALAAGGDDPVIHERLGESYRLLGDEPKARAAFDRARNR